MVEVHVEYSGQQNEQFCLFGGEVQESLSGGVEPGPKSLLLNRKGECELANTWF